MFDLTPRPCSGKFTEGSGNAECNNANRVGPVPAGVLAPDGLLVDRLLPQRSCAVLWEHLAAPCLSVIRGRRLEGN